MEKLVMEAVPTKSLWEQWENPSDFLVAVGEHLT